MIEPIIQFSDRDIEDLRRVVAISRRPVDPQRRDGLPEDRADMLRMTPVLNTSAETAPAGSVAEYYDVDDDGVTFAIRKCRYTGLTRIAMIPYEIPPGARGYGVVARGVPCLLRVGEGGFGNNRIGAVRGSWWASPLDLGHMTAMAPGAFSRLVPAEHWQWCVIGDDPATPVCVGYGHVIEGPPGTYTRYEDGIYGVFRTIIVNTNDISVSAHLSSLGFDSHTISGDVEWEWDATPPREGPITPQYPAGAGLHRLSLVDGVVCIPVSVHTTYRNSPKAWSNRAGSLILDISIPVTVIDADTILVGADPTTPEPSSTWWRSLALGNMPGLFADDPTSLFDDLEGGN